MELSLQDIASTIGIVDFLSSSYGLPGDVESRMACCE